MLKEEIEKIKNIEGEVRGVALKTDSEYILKEKGEDGLKKVEEKLKDFGFDLEYKKINSTDWYSLNLRISSLIVAKDIFNWNEEDIFKMGYFAPRRSFFVKTLLKFFASIEKTMYESSKYWKKHYSKGKLVVENLSIENKQITLSLKDFKSHPVFCEYYRGYFKSITELIISSDKINVIESKCVFQGDDNHEFFIEWE